ncbi:LacI family transcriptional regulator [Cellulomonas sp. DKR-3]|uniref:LacI family transcriptional regulator n=1 Tax=Cellulomonas fulva TaxID=2835530 RepID=A0ABS5TXG2_9CELL|nr:LacI family DNA-binding transcriptional regulator [Cellulomonas fulva]MBT0993848.1 LacI family transcriptional regulator [Cellulomonas fulva]
MTPPPHRRPSVTDVARVAGVSVGTVSNVLNRPDAVAPATRERVQAAIAELGFVRNGPARQLRRGAITTVGALLLDIRNPFFTDVARGIEDRLTVDDHTLMLASSDDDPAREAKYLHLFEEHGVLGLLVVPTSRSLEHLVEMQRRGVAVVLLDAPSTIAGMSSVSVDDEAGGELAAAHLLAQGHRRIVFLNGPHAIRQCEARRAGVDRAVRAAGLDPADVVEEVPLASLDAAGGDQALGGWVDAHDGATPDAVFCVNDLVAVGVQRHLRRRGGTDLLRRTAIVGYDDIEIAGELAVPLTSVRQPTHEMGYEATELLLRQAAGQPARHTVFQPELVVRASSTS